MRNLSNLLAVFVLVAMMGLLVGCGCGTANTPAEENMVDNTNEEVIPPADTVAEPVPNENVPNENTEHITNPDQPAESIVDDNGNLIDENGTGAATDHTTDVNTNANNAADTTGNVVGDAGNMVGDVIEEAGDAVGDVGRGVNRMADDATR